MGLIGIWLGIGCLSRFRVCAGALATHGSRWREACLRQLAPFPVSSIEQECPGISRELIRQVLQQLADEGLMQLEGRGRAARWVPLMTAESE